MNDDVKAAVEAAHARITAIEAKSGGEPDLRIGLWALEKVVDGEDARRAAAVAAATKPLADRIAELERCQRCSREDACFHLCGDCGDEPGVVADLHVAKLLAEAERDTLRARIAELEAQASGGHVCVKEPTDYARGYADAVARVVADLRLMAAHRKAWVPTSAIADAYRLLADRYERGEHEREGT